MITKKICLFITILILGLITGPPSVFSQTAGVSGRTIPDSFRKYNLPSLGENVFVFDPSMDMKEIQTVIDTIFARQSARRSEFSKNRYALLFKPGSYNLDIKVDYYMQVLGLGESPGDVVINGAVRSNTIHGNSVLTNFWRSVENLTVIPAADSTMVWGVSQAAPLRRVHVKGDLQLFDKGYASGGFLADSKVDGNITSGPQQQWFTRNSEIGKWVGGNWNMMFVGVSGAPAENWPELPYTTINETPIVREKPFLALDGKGFNVKVPKLKQNSIGPDWVSGIKSEKTLSIDKFYIAKPGIDNAETMNSALKKGKHLLITPGRYFLDKSLKVTKPGTVVMGMDLQRLFRRMAMPHLKYQMLTEYLSAGSLSMPVRFSQKSYLLPESRDPANRTPQILCFCMTYFSGSAVRMKVRPKYAWK